MAIGIVLIVALVLIYIVHIEIKKYFLNRKMRNIEEISGAPVIGVIGRFLGTSNFDIIDLVFKFFDEAKTNTFRFWAGPILVFGVHDSKAVETILTHENSLNKPFLYDYLHCKASLISVDKDEWRSQRRALNSVFSVSALQSSIPHINQKSRVLIDCMQPYLNRTGDLHRIISICMFETIMKTMLDVDMDLQRTKRGQQLYETEKQVLNSIQYRVPRLWLRPDFVYDFLSSVGRNERKHMEIANDMIVGVYNQKKDEIERQQAQTNDAKRVNNFMERCLELERQGIFSHEIVIEQMRMIIIAGIDSSALTIFGSLLMLAINQRHQELVVEELHSIFDSADCEVTQTHLAAMNYTERVIKESMRLLTPAPFIARQTTADIDLLNGTVPNGTIVIMSIMHMHRNSQIWGDNVLEFDPDRFLPENIAKRPPFSYIPFSAGSRNCAAIKYSMMSVKIILAHLLRRYKFTTDLKFEELKLFMHLVLDIANENPLRIQEREF